MNRAAKPIRERDVERYLVQQVKLLGGECRKIKWIGRTGAPDRLVMLPPRAIQSNGHVVRGTTIWAELKAPGIAPEPHQYREHTRMRRMGQRVEVVDSFLAVDQVLGINHKLKGDK